MPSLIACALTLNTPAGYCGWQLLGFGITSLVYASRGQPSSVHPVHAMGFVLPYCVCTPNTSLHAEQAILPAALGNRKPVHAGLAVPSRTHPRRPTSRASRSLHGSVAEGPTAMDAAAAGAEHGDSMANTATGVPATDTHGYAGRHGRHHAAVSTDVSLGAEQIVTPASQQVLSQHVGGQMRQQDALLHTDSQQRSQGGGQEQLLGPGQHMDFGQPEQPRGQIAKAGSDGTDERELLRRQRISAANKGKVPWNKGRKHSQATIAKIRATTMAAMKRPEVAEKVQEAAEKFRKAHTPESKAKIAASLAASKARKERKAAAQKAQEARKLNQAGAANDGEGGQAKRQRSRVKLADMTPEEVAAKKEAHRKAISDAIKAKWRDPEYRAKIESSLKSQEFQSKRGATRRARSGSSEKNTAREVARQVLDMAEERAAAAEAARLSKLEQAARVVRQAESALEALQAKMSAFLGDPVMYKKAEESITQVHRMVQLAQAQMRALQTGGPIPGAPAEPRHAAQHPDHPRGPPPSPNGAPVLPLAGPWPPSGTTVTAQWSAAAHVPEGDGWNGSSTPAEQDHREHTTSSDLNGTGDESHRAHAHGPGHGSDSAHMCNGGVGHPYANGHFNGHTSNGAALPLDVPGVASAGHTPGVVERTLGNMAHEDSNGANNASLAPSSRGTPNGAASPPAGGGTSPSTAGSVTGNDSPAQSGSLHYVNNIGLRPSIRPQAGGRVVSIRMSEGGPRARGSGTPLPGHAGGSTVNGVRGPVGGPIGGSGGGSVGPGSTRAPWLVSRSQQGPLSSAASSSTDEDDDQQPPTPGRDAPQNLGEYLP